MKQRLKNPVIPDYTPKAEREKKQEIVLDDRFCLVCTKKTAGYGAWQHGFTCSRKCETQQERKERERRFDPPATNACGSASNLCDPVASGAGD